MLGHVRFRAARLTAVETIARLEAHQVGRLDLHIGLGDWKGDALVLTDRAAENDTFAGVLGGAVDEPVAIADAFGGDQRALGVEPVENVFETLPFFADQVLRGNLEVVEEQLVGLVIDHVADWPDREPLADGVLELDDEDRHPLRLALDLGERRRAREQDHQVRVLHA